MKNNIRAYFFSSLAGALCLLGFMGEAQAAAQDGYCWNEKVGWTDFSGVTFNALTKKLAGTASYAEGIYGGGAFGAGEIDFADQGSAGVVRSNSTNGSGDYPLLGQAFSEQVGWFVANHGGTDEAAVTSGGELTGNFWTDEIGWFECSASDIGAGNTQIWEEANDLDTDNDGITDEEEGAMCDLYPGIDNCPVGDPEIEVTTTQDSDGDGITDEDEVSNGTNPLDANDPNAGGGGDSDGDGITDGAESAMCTTYPSLDNCPATNQTEINNTQDSDGDGSPDHVEFAAGTDPTDGDSPVTGGAGVSEEKDTDNDGISDALESNACVLYPGIDNCPVGDPEIEITPTQDSDGDGIPDFIEIINATNPLDSNDPVSGGDGGDGVGGTPPLDTDGDGIPDGLEATLCALYSGADNCPVGDPAIEITPTQDSDGDGIPDITELLNNTNPLDANDPTVPLTPSTAPDLEVASDKGISDTDNLTSDDTPTFTLPCHNTNTVTLYVDGVANGTGTCAGGTVSITVATALVDGSQDITYTETNTVPEESAPSAALVIEIDTNTPGDPVVTSHSDGADVNSPFALEGACESGEVVHISNSNISPNPTVSNCVDDIFSASINWLPIADGTTQILNLTQQDEAGNISGVVTLPLDVDLTPPGTPTVNALEVNDTTPSLGGTLPAPTTSTDTVEVTIDGNTYTATNNGDGTWTLPDDLISPALAEGTYDAEISVTDTAGNTTSTTITEVLTIDTTASSAPTVDAPSSGTTVTTSTPSVSGTGGEPGESITVTGPLGETCVTVVDALGAWSCTIDPALPDGGPQAISVTTTDAAGNESVTTSVPVTIDTTAPAPPTVDTHTHGESVNETTLTIGGTGGVPADVVNVVGPAGQSCSATVQPDGTWTCTLDAPLTEGSNTLTLTTTDPATNVSSPLNLILVVDLTDPKVTIDQASTQDDPTPLGQATFEIVFDEPIDIATFEVSDIAITGTDGTITSGILETAPNDGTTFQFTVTGMTTGDTVIVSVGAGVLEDLAGNPNEVFTIIDNQVTYDDSIDTDGDGVTDALEILIGTDPNVEDSDADGAEDNNNDLDNVHPSIEIQAPNNGDGNGDGLLDAAQNEVASIPNRFNTGYNSLQSNNVADCGQITGLVHTLEADLAVKDGGSDFPLGLWDFTIQCANPGDTASITIYLPELYDTTDKWSYKKYNSSTFTYEDISDFITYSTALVGAKTVTTISYNITDGSALDSDGLADGIITDPAGPTLPATERLNPVAQAINNAVGHTIRYAGIKREDVVKTTEGWSKHEFAEKYEESMEFAAERNEGSSGEIAIYIDNEGHERFAGYKKGEVAVSEMAEYQDLVTWRGDRQRSDSDIDMIVQQRKNKQNDTYLASASRFAPKYRVQNFRNISEEDPNYSLVLKMNSLGLMRPDFDGWVDYEKAINVFDVLEFVVLFNREPLATVREILTRPEYLSFVSKSGRRDSIVAYTALEAEYLNEEVKLNEIMTNDWVKENSGVELNTDVSSGVSRVLFAQDLLSIYKTIDPSLFAEIDQLLKKRFEAYKERRNQAEGGTLKSTAKKLWNRASRNEDQAQTILNRRKYEEEQAKKPPLQRRHNPNYKPVDPDNPGWNPLNKETEHAPIDRGDQSIIVRPEQARRLYKSKDSEEEVDQIIRLKNKDSIDSQVVENPLSIQ